MKEEDDIAKMISYSKITSFDIKQEWMDDMSTKLDAYNAEKKRRIFWYALPIALTIIALSILFYPSGIKTENAAISDSNIIKENTKSVDLTKYSTKQIQSSQKNEDQLNNQPQHNKLTPSNPNHSIPYQNELTPLSSPNIKPNSPQNNRNHHSISTQKTTSLKPTLTQHPVQLNYRNTQASTNDKKDDKTTDSNSRSNNQINPSGEKNNRTAITTQNTNRTVNNEATTPQAEQTRIPNKNETALSQKQDSTVNNTLTSTEIEQTDSTLENLNLVTQNRDSANTVETKTIVNERLVDSIKDITPEDTRLAQQRDSIKNNHLDGTKTKLSLPKTKRWSIGFTFGPDILDKQFTSNSNLQNFEQKKSEEQYSNTWGYNFEINRGLTNWLEISSGIGLKEYSGTNTYSTSTYNTYDTTTSFIDNSYMLFDSIYSQPDTAWIIIDSTLIIDTATVIIINTQTQIDSSKTVANGKTTSQYVQIPISAQITFLRTKKVSVYTNLGLSFGLLTKNTGLSLGYDNNIITNYTTRKLTLSSTIGLGFNYNFFGPFDYKLYAAYRGNLSNFSLQPNTKLKYNGFTFRTGLIFRF